MTKPAIPSQICHILALLAWLFLSCVNAQGPSLLGACRASPGCPPASPAEGAHSPGLGAGSPGALFFTAFPVALEPTPPPHTVASGMVRVPRPGFQKPALAQGDPCVCHSIPPVTGRKAACVSPLPQEELGTAVTSRRSRITGSVAAPDLGYGMASGSLHGSGIA